MDPRSTLALQRIEAPTIITIITTTWSIIINVRDDGAKRVCRLCEAAVRPGPLGADLGAEQRAVEQPRGRRRLRAPGRLLRLFFCCVVYIQRGRDAKLRRELI